MADTRASDIRILRELGKQVAEIAALPDQARTIAAWKALNGLKPVRPMVAIDQIPWHEMNVDDELTLRTSDPRHHAIERDLRQSLYRWKHMRADHVVESCVPVWPVVSGMGYGLGVDQDIAVGDPENSVVGHLYHDQLRTEADLEKIEMPCLRHDEAATAARVTEMRAIFDGILDVEVQGFSPMFNTWDKIVMWRGAEAVLTDLAERPEFVHKLIARVTQAETAMVDQIEELGLLPRRQSWIHCAGAFSDELPAPGHASRKTACRDVWACGMAQIFSSVSPDMHQEFELDYLNPLYARFGLVYYGCCEPLDRKMHIVRAVPHVRKISMSPWVDVEAGAAQIGRDFVFSRKPSPAFLAVDDWNPAAVEKDLRATLDACARNGCPVELILKDISTVRYQPQRLWEWARIAQDLCAG